MSGLHDATVLALESAEIEAFTDQYRSAGPEVVEQAGLVIEPLDKATVFATTRIDVLALNRALGLGLRERPTDEDLDALTDTLRSVGSPRFFVPVAPTETAAELGARLERRGLVFRNNWIRLQRRLTSLPTQRTTLDVREIDPRDGAPFTRIVARAFGYPEAIAPLARSIVGRDGWRHYMAYADGEPIATAAMYLAGDAAWFGFAATEAEHRGRGAQTALVVRRLHDASASGCTWVSVETAEQTSEREAPSFRNLMRLGFEVAYRRPNYLWTPEG